MIAKGNTHGNGTLLAKYLITGKENEYAELEQLRGFADDDVVEAFRSVHAMADATRCQRPFYHVQVRTPYGEHLTREQWIHVADRIEAKLDLAEQSRAVAFHEIDGQLHLHAVWSRIDEEDLKAKTLSFDHTALKEVCRELEIELGITRVSNEREGWDPPPPAREELDQANRLDVDWRAVRREIREAWTESESGRDLIDNLFNRELWLARGDRRDFVVVDPHGGVHALGRRLTGATAADTRKHLADLDPATLLDVADTRNALCESRSERYLTDPSPAPDRSGRFDVAGQDDPKPTLPRAEQGVGRAVGAVASVIAEGAASLAEGSIEMFGSLFDGSASSSTSTTSPQENTAMKNPENDPKEIQGAILRNAHRDTAASEPTVGAAILSNPMGATPDIAEQIREAFRRRREQEQERER